MSRVRRPARTSRPAPERNLDSASGALFRAAPVPAWVFDAATLRFLEVNDAAVDRYGWTRDEFLRMSLLDIRPAEDIQRFRDATNQVSQGLRFAGVWRHLTRSGEELEVEIHAHSIEFDGRPATLVFVHDVSERLRNERSVRETAERLQTLMRAMPGVVFMVDEEGRYLEGSGEDALLAAPAPAFIGRRLADFFPPVQVAEFLEIIHRALATQRTVDYSYQLEVSGGSVWFEARVSPLRAPVNGRRACVWAAWDVTERRRATEALRESETRLRAILDSEPECVKVIDPHGRLESMNRAGLRMLGVQRFEDLGDLMRFVAPHDRPAFRELTANALAGIPGELEFEAIRQDGTHMHFHSSAVPLRDAGGTIVSALAITRDVTEARRLSRAFKEQAELLKSVFDIIPVMIGVFDARGRMTLRNRSFTDTLGWTQDQHAALPEALAALFADPAVRGIAETFFAEAAGAWREFDTRTRDRRALRVAWAAVRLSGGGSILIGRDVTEQRRLETQALQSQRLESVGRLAGGVAHDFNNMLTVILGYVELLQLRLQSDATAGADVESIRQAAIRARDLTAQLLAFGRRQITRRRPMLPERVVEDMLPLLRGVLGESITLEFSRKTHGEAILADPAQLEQILMNLVLNARDAMPEGGRVTISLSRIEAGEECPIPADMEPGPCVRLAVSDTGHGMDAETLERVFEPFFSTKTAAAGTGLGLATAYGAVKQNGGHIVAASTPGVGTTFELFFPVTARAPVEGESVPPAPEGAPGRGEAILLAEDDDTVRSLLSTILTRAGYRVIAAASVTEALQRTRESAGIDLVVSDVVMADGSGLDIVRATEEHHPRARRLLISGHAESDAVREYLRDPNVNFLQKPFAPAVLLERVRELLAATRG